MSTKKQDGPEVIYMSPAGHERVVHNNGSISIEIAFKDAMGGTAWHPARDLKDRERIMVSTIVSMRAETERLRNG